jgi:hypothetical protein
MGCCSSVDLAENNVDGTDIRHRVGQHVALGHEVDCLQMGARILQR